MKISQQIKHRYIDKNGKEVIVLEEADVPFETRKRKKAKKFFNNLKRYR